MDMRIEIGNLFLTEFGRKLTMTRNNATRPVARLAKVADRWMPALAALLTLHIGRAPVRADLVYVASLDNNTIVSFDTTASPPTPTTFASSGLDHPYFLAFDAAGNLYAANSGNNTIERFTPGGVGSLFASTGLSFPEGLAFDAAGNLYVANQGNNTIERFTPGGVGSVFTTNVSGGPIGLAIQASAVPEPSSLVLAVIGALLMLSYAGHRSRKRGRMAVLPGEAGVESNAISLT